MDRSFQAPLTSILIGINIFVYILSVFASGEFESIPLGTLVSFGAIYGPVIVGDDAWWRLLSAMFLHGSITHLLMNMVSLYIVGRSIEPYLGKNRYISLYLISGLLGGVASFYMHPLSVAVGASGAIFGIFGALVGFVLANRARSAEAARAFMQDAAVILGINLLLGIIVPTIDMSAHIAGLVTGFIGGYTAARFPDRFGHFLLLSLSLLILSVLYLKDYAIPTPL